MHRANRKAVLLSGFVFLLFTVLLAKPFAVQEDRKASLEHPLVITQIPVNKTVQHALGKAGGMLRTGYGTGGRIILLSPDLSVANLTAGFHSAADPSLSFDGRRLLFAGKKTAADPWNIYEMDLDGGNLRRITGGIGDCRSPLYLSTFYTIISPQPWYQLAFVGSERGNVNECGRGVNTNLYSCKLNGEFVRRLTHNLSSDMDPFLSQDGRLIFASWKRSRLDHGPEGFFSLFSINTDGGDMAIFADGGGKRIMHMPCVTPAGLVVFVEADRVEWDGAGTLGSVQNRRPLHSYRALTGAGDGLFHGPSLLPGGRLLVSRRPADGGGSHGVYVFDPADGGITEVFDDPEWHDIQAKVCCERPEPDGRSSVVTEKDPHGTFYCLNASISDLEDPDWLEDNDVQSVRVIEGRGVTADSFEPGMPSLAHRRILGEVPLEKDGSFNIEVPAATPIELQLLDSRGMSVRSCGWIWAMNHEPRGCIGCHEDPELTPENVFVDAVKKPSVFLAVPEEQRRSIYFTRDVWPVMARTCMQCHHAGHPSLKLSAETAYDTLLQGASGGRGRYVHPGRARTSPLVWKLFGSVTARPWDGAVWNRDISPMPPPGHEQLTERERRMIIEWIDTGALRDEAP